MKRQCDRTLGVYSGGFACAPMQAQHWWVDTMHCTTAAYSPPGVPHPGCAPGALPQVVPPAHLGLVLKISF